MRYFGGNYFALNDVAMSARVRFPQMRWFLQEALRALADSEFQQLVWVARRSDAEKRWHANFDEVVHTILDDLDLGRDPDKSIGSFTCNVDEARAAAEVACAIERLLKKYGTRRSDAEYVATREWSEVMQLARQALDLMKD
ncbi:MAG: hypothetical protein K8T90_17655 [Planctomycetes bacterium]|nr:hypothetical protein [Planctomycetota bacterium]